MSIPGIKPCAPSHEEIIYITIVSQNPELYMKQKNPESMKDSGIMYIFVFVFVMIRLDKTHGK